MWMVNGHAIKNIIVKKILKTFVLGGYLVKKE